MATEIMLQPLAFQGVATLALEFYITDDRNDENKEQEYGPTEQQV